MRDRYETFENNLLCKNNKNWTRVLENKNFGTMAWKSEKEVKNDNFKNILNSLFTNVSKKKTK